MRNTFYQTGKIIPKRGLKRFTENGAVFEDGTEVHDIDLVILSTGFGVNLDILDVPGFKGTTYLSQTVYNEPVILVKCMNVEIEYSTFKIELQI